MTVLDLDPPPALRLVSTTGASPARDHRYRTSATLYGPARCLYREVLQWALEWGEPVDPDALRVILATKQAGAAGPIRRFTGSAIWQLMFVDVVAWCRARKLELPRQAAPSLTTLLRYLESTDGFDPDSDEPIELYEAVDECTGGWTDPRPSTPVGRRRSLRSNRGPQRT